MLFLKICFVVVHVCLVAFFIASILSKETKPTEVAKTYGQLLKFGMDIEVVEIDEHQYLYCHDSRFGSLCHKADCKYCEKKK